MGRGLFLDSMSSSTRRLYCLFLAKRFISTSNKHIVSYFNRLLSYEIQLENSYDFVFRCRINASSMCSPSSLTHSFGMIVVCCRLLQQQIGVRKMEYTELTYLFCNLIKCLIFNITARGAATPTNSAGTLHVLFNLNSVNGFVVVSDVGECDHNSVQNCRSQSTASASR